MTTAGEPQPVRQRTLEILWSTWALFAGIACLMVANGLQGTLLALRAQAESFPTAVTGAMMSAYFVGMLAGSGMAPGMLARVGHVRVFAALASIASVTILVHSLVVHPVAWTAMRFLTGWCYAGLFVVAESWLNERASNLSRGRILGLYLVVVYGGMASGQLALNFGDVRAFGLYILTSILVSLSLVPILLSVSPAPVPGRVRRVKLRALFAVSPLAMTAALLSGVAQGALFGMGPVFGRQAGGEYPEVALLMAAPLLGGILSQWPVGRLSDRFDRRRVIVAASVLAGGAALGLLIAGRSGTWEPSLVAWMGLLGAAALPLYGLSIAQVNDHLEPEQIVPAAATLVFAMGLGLAAGPLLAALAMLAMGPAGFASLELVVHAAIAGHALWRMHARPPPPVGEQTPYVPTAARGSPISAVLAAEEALEASGGESGSPDGEGQGPGGGGESPEAGLPGRADQGSGSG